MRAVWNEWFHLSSAMIAPRPEQNVLKALDDWNDWFHTFPSLASSEPTGEPTMRIALSQIAPNPHRDLARNPLEPDQVSSVRASINRTGFWENVVVREHPEHAGHYQLAYGHNRLAALRENGEQSAEFIVKPLSDYDMLVAMIDENATQRNQTVRIVFENITAAIRLGEKLISETQTVAEFNAKANPSNFARIFNTLPNIEGCIDLYNVPIAEDGPVFVWRENEYQKAKDCVQSGEGLGRGFLEHFLPSGLKYQPNTIQNALDSYYAEARKAAAKRKAEESAAEAKRLAEESAKARAEAEAKEKAEAEARAKQQAERRAREDAERRAQQAADETDRKAAHDEAIRRAKAEAAAKRQADARAKEAEAHRKAEAARAAKAAEAKAAEAKARDDVERIDIRGFDRSLLERLSTASHMQEIVQLARAEKIPSEYHARLIDACVNEGWTTGGGRSNQIAHTILNAGRAWWYKTSGKAERDRKAATREYAKWKHREKTLDEFVRETVTSIKDLIKALDAIKPFTDQIENPTLVSSFDAHLGALSSACIAVRDGMKKTDRAVSPELAQLEQLL